MPHATPTGRLAIRLNRVGTASFTPSVKTRALAGDSASALPRNDRMLELTIGIIDSATQSTGKAVRGNRNDENRNNLRGFCGAGLKVFLPEPQKKWYSPARALHSVTRCVTGEPYHTLEAATFSQLPSSISLRPACGRNHRVVVEVLCN